MSKAREVSLLAVLSALCVIGRWVCIGIPNISPMTAVVIIVSQRYGFKMGAQLVVVSTLVSNILMGMGIWTLYQIAAWLFIVFIVCKASSCKLYSGAVMAGFAGYLFGFIVSLEKLLYGGPIIFWTYYLTGLPFDTLHSMGNVIFYPLCYSVLNKMFKRF